MVAALLLHTQKGGVAQEEPGGFPPGSHGIAGDAGGVVPPPPTGGCGRGTAGLLGVGMVGIPGIPVGAPPGAGVAD